MTKLTQESQLESEKNEYNLINDDDDDDEYDNNVMLYFWCLVLIGSNYFMGPYNFGSTLIQSILN